MYHDLCNLEEKMSALRVELQEALCHYTSDTLAYIMTVKQFCGSSSEWMDARIVEMSKLKNLKTSNNSSSKQQLELTAVLDQTLVGLEKLNCFLDAVEKLAVTSFFVFIEGNQLLHPPEGVCLEQIQAVIIAAWQICPLLIVFKRDAKAFFCPKLQNVDVLANELDKYIQITEWICENLDISRLSLTMSSSIEVNLDVDLSEDEMQRMLWHINYLDGIRMDEDFRLVFLFQEESSSGFVNQFNKRQTRMLQFLKDLEKTADQLVRTNKGAKISSVVGSSVGAVGGVLSIVGLALIPVTAGLSLGLSIGGVGLGVGSGVSGLVTTATKIRADKMQKNKADATIQRFMDNVQSLQVCLYEATHRPVKIGVGLEELVLRVHRVLTSISVGTAVAEVASAVEALKSERVVVSVGKAAQEGKALCNVPRVASDIPDLGQAALKGSLALSKSARAGLIGLNALFLGMDVFFICKDSIDLSEGSETQLSQFIRARAALWRSEVDAWEKMHDSLREGLLTSEKHLAVLLEPFYL